MKRTLSILTLPGLAMAVLAIVHTPFSMSARCEVVETSDGVLWSPDG